MVKVKKLSLKKVNTIFQTKNPNGVIFKEPKKSGVNVCFNTEGSPCYQYIEKCYHSLLIKLGFTFAELDVYLTEDNIYRVWREEFYQMKMQECV